MQLSPYGYEQPTSSDDTLCVLQVRQQVGKGILQFPCYKLHCLLLVLHLAVLVLEHAEDVAVLWLVQQVPCNSLPQNTNSSKGGGWWLVADLQT